MFAGGIGENSAPVRRRICDGLQFLGIEIDDTLNQQHAARISTGAVAVRVIRTDEESVIAELTWPRAGNDRRRSGNMIETSSPVLDAQTARKIDAILARSQTLLSVGHDLSLRQPLVEEPLAIAHIKRMLLGHWGTTPGQNFIYTHLNRVIKKYDLDMIYMSGPGHGGRRRWSAARISRALTARCIRISARMKRD